MLLRLDECEFEFVLAGPPLSDENGDAKKENEATKRALIDATLVFLTVRFDSATFRRDRSLHCSTRTHRVRLSERRTNG